MPEAVLYIPSVLLNVGMLAEAIKIAITERAKLVLLISIRNQACFRGQCFISLRDYEPGNKL